jgi:predicted anti-sigma-YlaC factor YlaD
MLAIAPGLLTTLAIALLGRRGISPQLCALVPRGPIHHPLAGNPTLGAVLSGSRFEVDYHDWVCRNITPLYDQTIGDAVNFVASLGVIPLAASTALGIALLALTILSLSHVSGVPFSRMRSMLRRRSGWVLSGLALFVPIFLTGADWTRWWVMITFDVGVVFALFASGEKESAEPLTLSTRTILFVVALVLAAPLGGIPGLGLPVPM